MQYLRETDDGFKILVTKKMRKCLTDEKIREVVDRTIGVLEAKMMCKKLYYKNPIELWTVFDNDFLAWEVGIVFTMVYGTGRRSKAFMRRQVKSIAEFLPKVREKAIKEFSKLGLEKEVK